MLRVVFWLCTGLAIWPTTAAALPTLIQHVHTASNYDPSELGNGFKVHLADPARANNCVILGISYPNATNRTVSVSDNMGNNWTAGPSATNGSTMTRLFYVTGVLAGTRDVTVTFDRSLSGFQAVISEFYNVALTAAADDSTGNAASNVPTITAGSMTTTTAGDLVYNYAYTNNYSAAFTGMSAGSGFSLLSADRLRGAVAQYGVQGTAGNINPSLTVTASSGSFNSVALALKPATSGTAPSPGIRVARIYHGFWQGQPALQFPSTGNLLVFATSFGPGNTNISSISSTPGNTWTKVPASLSGSSSPQILYAANANASPALAFSINANASEVQFAIYDVVGAAASPFDVASEANGSVNNHADILDAPRISPTTANGLVIATLPMGHGPPVALVGTGFYFDSVTYPGEVDGSTFESSDGYGHAYHSGPGPLSFHWQVGSAAEQPSAWWALAVAFKAGPAPTGSPPAAPTNFTLGP